ncbi:ThiF family adenylyltransferase [Paenibacillus beijingensis]|uniref:Uncharacterized protein n=1 Tax=Paenibacillus beijingensis TaxID=1126833 RepID=A0A0D5NLZ9_9BACL|nr:ThiF family adenylyltransferase [Paenibacillus beijingensis]AJY76281.1 hypothetical protein VN24_19095 [Paenibacillus beijingensis]
MSQKLISLSPDLKRLRDEGYEIEARSDAYALVHHVPYVNAKREIKYGTLVSDLILSANVTINPISNHVIHFCGEYPCDMHGSPIEGIRHQEPNQRLDASIIMNYSFSNRPSTGYANYYDKFIQYIKILSAPAQALDDSVTAQTYRPIESDQESQSVFHYYDTNSSRANIAPISRKLEGQKIAIIGLGGTGSYILDLIAKTPVAEIHLFDGDEFLQHNAFRSPGAPSLKTLEKREKKAKYFRDIYSHMHKGIHFHPEHLSTNNIGNILFADFVFIAIDKGTAKRVIVKVLLEHGKPFIDVGIGVDIVDESLIGQIRLTTANQNKNDHVYDRISFGDVEEDVYSTNIQIAELNALNASLAVIQWKKLYGFYQPSSFEFNSTHSTYTGDLLNEDRHE